LYYPYFPVLFSNFGVLSGPDRIRKTLDFWGLASQKFALCRYIGVLTGVPILGLCRYIFEETEKPPGKGFMVLYRGFDKGSDFWLYVAIFLVVWENPRQMEFMSLSAGASYQPAPFLAHGGLARRREPLSMAL
jgi:hypothetical protein